MLFQGQPLLSQQPETFKVNFRVYGLRPGDYKDLVAVDHKLNLIELQFEKKERSARYEATLSKSNPSLYFYRNPLPEVAQRKPIASIRLGTEKTDFLLIFGKLGVKGDTDQFHISAFGDDHKSFPAGSVRILNFTDRQLRGKANKTTFALNPLDSSKPIKGRENGDTGVVIVVEGEDRYHLVYNNTITIRESDRTILLLRQPVRRDSLRLGGHVIKYSAD